MAIPQINKFIIEIKIANHIYTPFIMDIFGAKKGSRVKRKWKKLHEGIHPGYDVIKMRAELITKRNNELVLLLRSQTPPNMSIRKALWRVII